MENNRQNLTSVNLRKSRLMWYKIQNRPSWFTHCCIVLPILLLYLNQYVGVLFTLIRRHIYYERGRTMLTSAVQYDQFEAIFQ